MLPLVLFTRDGRDVYSSNCSEDLDLGASLSKYFAHESRTCDHCGSDNSCLRERLVDHWYVKIMSLYFRKQIPTYCLFICRPKYLVSTLIGNDVGPGRPSRSVVNCPEILDTAQVLSPHDAPGNHATPVKYRLLGYVLHLYQGRGHFMCNHRHPEGWIRYECETLTRLADPVQNGFCSDPDTCLVYYERQDDNEFDEDGMDQPFDPQEEGGESDPSSDSKKRTRSPSTP